MFEPGETVVCIETPCLEDVYPHLLPLVIIWPKKGMFYQVVRMLHVDNVDWVELRGDPHIGWQVCYFAKLPKIEPEPIELVVEKPKEVEYA